MTAPVRFGDILTTASAIAAFLGAPDVTAAHLADAIAVLRGEKAMDDLGRPVSPLVARSGRRQSGAEAAVREVVQRWFVDTGSDINAQMDDAAIARLRAELQAIIRHP